MQAADDGATPRGGPVLRPVADAVAGLRPQESPPARGLLHDGAFRTALRASIAVAVVVGVVMLLARGWPVVQPFLVALVLATALWPWVTRLTTLRIGPRGWRMPRIVATALIYVTTVGAIGAAMWFTLLALLPQVDPLLNTLPPQADPLRQYLEPFRGGDLGRAAREVSEDVAREVGEGVARAARGQAAATAAGPAAPIDAAALVVGLFGGLLNIGLVLLFTFFLLLEGHIIAQSLMFLLPREQRPHLRELGLRVRDRMSRWVLAELIYAAVGGVLVGGALFLLQVPSAWLYAVLAAVLAIMPGVGPALAVVPAIFVALALEPWQLIGVGVFGLILYLLDGTVIVPKIFGDALRLPVVVMLASMLLGATLMGVWGALIAPQIAAAAHVLIQDYARGQAS